MKKTIRIVAVAMVALMLMLTLASCGATPNSDPEAAKEALKSNGYSVISIPTLGFSGCDKNISATKIDGESAEAVTIFYFKDAESADKAYEEVEKLADAAKNEDGGKDIIIDKSGKMIYFGTKNAIKAAA